MLVGFALCLVGLVALYVRYVRRAGGLGKTGLITSIASLVLLTMGYPFSFMTQVDLFLLVILGGLALMLGPLLFGIAALQKGCATTLLESPATAHRPYRLRLVLRGESVPVSGSSSSGDDPLGPKDRDPQERDDYTATGHILSRGDSEVADPYDSYGTRETEVAIEEFVNRLLELYPDLDPIRVSELIAERVQDIVAAAGRGEGY